MRILLTGPINTVHLQDMALALAEQGVEVVAAGTEWPGEPPTLTASGIRTLRTARPYVLGLAQVIAETRPDVVHAHWMPYAAKAILARARPLIAQPWGSDVYRAPAAFRAANRVTARLADRVVSDSADLAAAIGARDPHIFNWGVDLRRFAPGDGQAAKRALGVDPGPLVLSPRLLTPLYNPRTILEAFARLDVPGAQLALKYRGEGPPDLGPLPDRVHLVGSVPYERMADWYRAADVCVSIPDTDSSPRSVWEAMACGTPCVVSDLGWAREQLRPGADALTTPIEAGAVAHAITGVLTDPDLAASLSANGRALVERTRDRELQTRSLVALYEELA